MARAQQEVLRPLTTEEQVALQRLKVATSGRVDTMRRATALLAVAEDASLTAAAPQAVPRSTSTVANLSGRCTRRGVAAVRIAPGRGRKPTYAADARSRIVATAQRAPDRKVDGAGTWSLSTLQRTLRREALPRVGATTVRRVLQDAGSS